MEKAAQEKGKSVATIQAGIFLRLTKRLGWKAAPTRDELDAVAKRLKWRLKRKPGVTPVKELERRKRARGTFARGWKLGKIEQTGTRIRIWIVNAVKYAGIVNDDKHISEEAANITRADYQGKLQKLAKDVTGVF